MMDWLKRLASPAGPPPAKRERRTLGYAGAQQTRWVDFLTTLEAAHKERQRDLARLKAHSRDLAKNNVYMRRFLEMVSTNMVGPDGIGMESEILDAQGKPRKELNDQVEAGWQQWGRCCTPDGLMGWVDFQHLVAETVAQDGEALVRLVRGFDNASRFAVELIDADRLDHTYNTQLSGGVRVIMGVEVNAWGRPLAYHLWSAHPSDREGQPARIRVPADQILHVYTKDRARATRGLPWATPVMVQLNMLGRLWTSELAAANAEADRLGIVKTAQGIPLEEFGEDGSDPVAAANSLESEHAQFLGLDPGLDIVFPNIQHPNSALPQFTAFLLKGIAAGFGVAYHSMSGDVSDANFSSARVALLEERDFWRKRQTWFIANLCEPVFRAWLEMAAAARMVKLPAADPLTMAAPTWWPRTWDWVDPEKDVNAALNAIRGDLSTYQQELGKRGQDWRETFRQRAEEEKELKALGLAQAAAAPVPGALDAPAAAGAEAVQDTALNGAQVESLLNIIQQVASGLLPKDSAEAMVKAAFPGISEATVKAMLAPIQPGSAKPQQTTENPNA